MPPGSSAHTGARTSSWPDQAQDNKRRRLHSARTFERALAEIESDDELDGFPMSEDDMVASWFRL